AGGQGGGVRGGRQGVDRPGTDRAGIAADQVRPERGGQVRRLGGAVGLLGRRVVGLGGGQGLLGGGPLGLRPGDGGGQVGGLGTQAVALGVRVEQPPQGPAVARRNERRRDLLLLPLGGFHLGGGRVHRGAG